MVCSWQKTKRPKQVEVRVSDSDQDWNAGSPDAFRENQERLENRYLPGDLVELRLSNGQDDGHPVYDAWHTDSSGEERIVGRTNDQFGEFMSEYVWGRTPDVISGLSAEIPDTSSMLPSLAQDVGLAAHGLHLRARFFGLGTLEW
jgi:hypothetical protein